MTIAMLGCSTVLIAGLGCLSETAAPLSESVPRIALFGGLADQPQAVMGVTFDTKRKGIVVMEVRKGLPADRAGIKPGDTILRADNRQFAEPFDFIQFVRTKKPGDVVSLVVQRGQKAMEFKVQLVALPGP